MNPRNVLLLVIHIALALFLVYAGAFLIPHGVSLGPFDRRALQHLVGFWGLAIILQGFAASYYLWTVYSVYVLLFGLVVAVELFFPGALQLSGEVHQVIRCGTVYLVFNLGMAAYFRTKNRKLVATGGVLVCFLVSFSWELIQQPVVGVYDGPPRHTIQMAQVVADVVGIALAFATTWGITLRSTGSARISAQILR